MQGSTWAQGACNNWAVVSDRSRRHAIRFFSGQMHARIPARPHRNHGPLRTIETDRPMAFPRQPPIPHNSPQPSRTLAALFIHHKRRRDVWSWGRGGDCGMLAVCLFYYVACLASCLLCSDKGDEPDAVPKAFIKTKKN